MSRLSAKYLAGSIPATKLIQTDLSQFTTSAQGVVSASGGGSVNFLRADNTWAIPPGAVSTVFGRTGTVTATSGDYSVAQVTGAAPLASPTFTGTVTAPTFVGALTGNASTSTSSTNFSGALSGDVTGNQSSTAISASTVTGKLITGYSSAAGTVAATDTILQAINKINGNDALKAPIASPTFTGAIALTNPTGNSIFTITATTATALAISGYVSGTASGIVGMNGTGTGGILGGAAANAMVIANQSAAALQFGTNNAVNITILSGGNTGVGLNNPTLPLQIQTPTTAGTSYSFGVTRQGSSTPALYLGSVVTTNEALIAANNTPLRIGYDSGGTFTETLNIQTSGTATFTGNIGFTTTTSQGIKGTIVSGNAAAGNVGEYLSQFDTLGSHNLTTGVISIVTTTALALTPGDWDLTGIIAIEQVGGGTLSMSFFRAGISAANNSFSGLEGDNWVYGFGATGSTDGAIIIPAFRVNVTGNTNYFLIAQAGFSGASCAVGGRISARRVR